ncbi:GntR family transcriptional regulator [Microbacterium sp. NPDC090225]|uniref:GntR family transcriptional regulator n=1 Tax=Microbacterium sp. NPDC090225 TaxID=3364207 RepID=UPI0037F5443F
MPVPRSAGPKPERRLYRDEAHDRIRNAILDGTLKPGEALDDKELQAWLGLSRTPIRDALLALQIEGLVEIHAQSRTRVVQPEPGEVEDSVQALGAIMGGVMRVTVPALTDEARERLIAQTEIASTAVRAQDAGAHLDAALDVYEALIDHCPNPTLVRIARASLVPLTFRYRAALGIRTPNWELLDATWAKVREGFIAGDNVLAELAFEEMHRLPLPTRAWAPAEWKQTE